MFPLELLAILFLVCSASAFPQILPTVNVTVPSGDSFPPVETTFPPDDQFGIPWNDPCSTETCWPVNFIPDLPTATGWGTDDNNLNPAPTGAVVPVPPAIVITTHTPTIVGIRTGLLPGFTRLPVQTKAPTGGAQPVQEPESQTEGDHPTVPRPAHASGPKAGSSPPHTPPPVPQQSSSINLLLEIISRLNDFPSASSSQPTISAVPTPDTNPPPPSSPAQPALSSNNNNNSSSSNNNTDASLTIGSETITLKPGLSTVVGEGTLISISMDQSGQTIITIASSGVGVTATVSAALATVTVPRNGFEASITAAARPGSSVTSGGGEAVASSSSRAVAAGRIGGGGGGNMPELGWWARVILSLLGIGIFL